MGEASSTSGAEEIMHTFWWGKVKRQILNFRARQIWEDGMKCLYKKGDGAYPSK